MKTTILAITTALVATSCTKSHLTKAETVAQQVRSASDYKEYVCSGIQRFSDSVPEIKAAKRLCDTAATAQEILATLAGPICKAE